MWMGACAGLWWMLPELAQWRSEIRGAQQLYKASFSPDGGWLATLHFERSSGYRPFQFWDTKTGLPAKPLKEDDDGCSEVLFSPDGRWLATDQLKPQEKLRHDWSVWEAQSGKRLRVEGTDFSQSVVKCYSPEGPLGVLLACEMELDRLSCVRLLRMPSLEPVLTIQNAYGPIAFSADARFVVVRKATANCIAQVYEVATGKLIGQIDPPSPDKDRWPNPLASNFELSPDGSRLLIFTRYREIGPRYVPVAIHLADVASGKVYAEWPNVQFIGVAHDSRDVVFGDVGLSSFQGRIQIADLDTGAIRCKIETAIDTDFSYLEPDPYAAETGGQWLAIKVPDDSFKTRFVDWLRGRFPNWISPNGSSAVAINIYDAASGTFRCRIPTSSGWKSFHLSPNGQKLVTERVNGVLDIYDLPPNKPLGWFAAGAGVLALPIAWVARRSVRRLRREAA
jgi:WD40 repeat protein